MVVTDWSITTTDALREAGLRILNYLPNLFGALVILIIGILLANLGRWFVTKIIESTGLQKWFEDLSFAQTLREAKISTNLARLIGEFVKWIIIILFLIPAAEELGLTQISNILNDLIHYLPNVAIAIIILFLGVIFAEFISGIVRATAASMGTRSANGLSILARYVIFIFAALSALSQLGIASQIINVLVYGFVGAISIGAALAFGLGGKDAASDIIAKVRQDFTDKK